MAIIVPDTLEVEVLTNLVTPALSMRLYSNNYTPVSGSTVTAFTEVSGGGYALKALTLAHWVITAGDPSTAIFDADQIWTFTGPTDSPSTIFGYYVTRDSDGKMLWAERFPAGNVPFTPINGSIIRVLPKFSAQSLF